MFKKIFPGCSAKPKQEASKRHDSASSIADLDGASSSDTENSDNHCRPRAENLEDYEGSELVHGILSQSSPDDDDSSASEYSRGYGSDYDDDDDEGRRRRREWRVFCKWDVWTSYSYRTQ